MTVRRIGLWTVAAALVAAALVAAGSAAAQPKQPAASTTAPSQPAAQGQSQDQQPVQIEAATLEVRDKQKTATFSGDVHVVQGDTTMNCKTLVVFYGKDVGLGTTGTTSSASSEKPTTTLPSDSQSIRRIEARGDVTVFTKDQNASGDLGVYDPTTKTITLTGNVVVTQGPNVIHGERVVVNTVTGNARVESGERTVTGANPTPGRVRAVIVPHSDQKGGSSGLMQIGPPRSN